MEKTSSKYNINSDWEEDLEKELQEKLKKGEIDKAEYDRIWREEIQYAINDMCH